MTEPPPFCGPPPPGGSAAAIAATRRGVAGVGVGWVGLAWSSRGLALISPLAATAESARHWLDALSTGPRPTTIESATEPAAAALAAYLAGGRCPTAARSTSPGCHPSHSERWRRSGTFRTARRAPTAGWPGAWAGPKAARAAGRAIGANPLAPLIPCHRVVGANGRLTGYRWGIALKRWLLALEGVHLPR